MTSSISIKLKRRPKTNELPTSTVLDALLNPLRPALVASLKVCMVLVICGVSSCASRRSVGVPSGDGLNSTMVVNQFQNAEYEVLWLRDTTTDLSLGINLGDFKDTSFGTRIYDSNVGPAEFSGFPDDIILANPAGRIQFAYAPYMKWKRYVGVENGGQKAVSHYSRTSSDGWLTKYIEPDLLARYDTIAADIDVTHSMIRGRGYVRTLVRVKNSYPVPTRFWWLYQDGVTLHIPDGTQRENTPMTEEKLGDYFQSLPKGLPWMAMTNKARGITSAIYAPNSSFLFSTPHFRLLTFATPQDCKNSGFECTLGGNDRAIPNQRRYSDEISDWFSDAVDRKSQPDDLKVHGALFDLGELQPNEEKYLEYYRFGVTGESEPTAIRRAINSRIRQIQSDAQE